MKGKPFYGQSRLLMERYPKAKLRVFDKGGDHTVFLFPQEYVYVDVNCKLFGC